MALTLNIKVNDLGSKAIQSFKDTTKRSFDDIRKNSESTLSGISDGSKKAKTGISSLKGAIGGLAGVFAVREIVQFSKTLINLASDAEELNSMFDAVFKEQSRQVNDWAQKLGKSVGRATTDLKAMAASAQDTFVPFGFARDKAAELSKGLAELAIDVGSFKNAADTDVMNNFMSAIVGNHEAVRKYGIVITEATLKQEALAMGITGNVKDLSNQEKALIRMNLIYKGSSDAVGDAMRTADSYANRMKAFKGQLKEAGEALGQMLLPIAAKTLEWASIALDKIQSIIDLGDKSKHEPIKVRRNKAERDAAKRRRKAQEGEVQRQNEVNGGLEKYLNLIKEISSEERSRASQDITPDLISKMELPETDIPYRFYKSQLDTTGQILDKELKMTEEGAQAQINTRQRLNDELAAIDQERLQTIGNFVSESVAYLAAGGEAYKILAIKDTMVSTYSAAQKIFEAVSSQAWLGVLALPTAIAAATAAVGMGLARVKSISQAATGADFVTSGPQLMLVGENPGGREHVQVTPMSSPNINGPKNSRQTVININAQSIDPNFVKYDLMPMIRRAQAEGF